MAGLVEMVGGDDHDGAPRRVLLDHVQDPLLAGDVQAGDGLIEHDDVGLAGQHLGDPDPLLLPSAEFAEAPVLELVHVELLARLPHGGPILAPEPSEQPPLAVAAHGQHLSRGYGHPAGGKMLAHVGQILGHAADAARGGLLQTGHALQHGRLARSVDAHHRRRRARLEAVGHAIERGDLIEPYGKFLDLDGVHHGRVFLTDRLPIRSASGPNGIFPPCHPPPLPLWKRAERSPRTARQPTRCRPALPTRLHG